MFENFCSNKEGEPDMENNKKFLKNKRIRAAAFFLAAVLMTGGSISGFASLRNEEEKIYKYYTSISIKKGDTLWSIASEYMTAEYDSIEEYIMEVKKLNHISGNKIYTGKYLTIPYYSAESTSLN